MSDSTRYGYSFSWAENPNGRTTITASGFTDPAERDASFKRALVGSGYTEPRWWQWWRWGEHRPMSFLPTAIRQQEKP